MNNFFLAAVDFATPRTGPRMLQVVVVHQQHSLTCLRFVLWLVRTGSVKEMGKCTAESETEEGIANAVRKKLDTFAIPVSTLLELN